MSTAEELLNSLAEEAEAGTATEGHIVIARDRSITVPDELRRIAVQYDHNVETVTFDCPRYWDKCDLALMRIYINYMRPDGQVGSFLCEPVTVDAEDKNMIHFDWMISGNVTQFAGDIAFLVCAKKVDIKTGLEEVHWNSELNTEMHVSEGMKCLDTILRRYPDIISQLLIRMDVTEENIKTWKAETEKQLTDHVASIEGTAKSYMESAGKSAGVATNQANIAVEKAASAEQSATFADERASAAEAVKDQVFGVVNSALATETKPGLVMGGENTIDDDGTLVLTKTTTDRILTDSKAGGLKVNKIAGKSVQAKTTGAQLLDTRGLTVLTKNGITFTPVYDTDGRLKYIEANGTNTSDSSCAIYSIPITNLNIGEKYTMNGCPTGGSISTYMIQVANFGNNFGDGVTATVTENTSSIMNLLVAKSVTVSNLRFYPMLNAGDTALPYEPYTGGKPSPNPEYPQPITSVGDTGAVEVDVVGANLYDASHNIDGAIICSHGTVTEDNGVLTINATGADAYVGGIVNAGKEYTADRGQLISIPNRETEITISVSNQQYDKIFATFYDENKVSLGYRRVNTGTYQIPEGAKYFSFRIGIENSIAGTTYSTKIMVNYGTEPLPWQPYRRKTLTLNTEGGLLGIPVESGGNVVDADGQEYIADTIYQNQDGQWKWRHNVENYDISNDSPLDEISNSVGIKDTHAYYRFTDNSAKRHGEILSNVLQKNIELVWGKDISSCWIMADNLIDFALPYEILGITKDATREERVTALRTYVATNSIYFLVELAEPYETDLTAEEAEALLNLRAYDIQTHIFTDSEVEPIIEVEYGTSPVGAHALEALENGKYLMGNVKKIINTNEFAEYMLSEALPKLCDKYITSEGRYDVCFKCSSSDGNFIGFVIMSNNVWSGLMINATTNSTYAFYRLANRNATIQLLNNPKILSDYDTMMVNTVAGYHADALAVKEGFERLNGMYLKHDSATGAPMWSVDGVDWHFFEHWHIGAAGVPDKTLTDDYQGFTEPNGCYTKMAYIYHTHSKENGCYTTVYRDCMELRPHPYDEGTQWICSVCGKWSGDTGTSTRPTDHCYHYVDVFNCTKTEGSTIDKTYYACNCGKTAGGYTKMRYQ